MPLANNTSRQGLVASPKSLRFESIFPTHTHLLRHGVRLIASLSHAPCRHVFYGLVFPRLR
jgi:hypothetical protein